MKELTDIVKNQIVVELNDKTVTFIKYNDGFRVKVAYDLTTPRLTSGENSLSYFLDTLIKSIVSNVVDYNDRYFKSYTWFLEG
jgi:hypothetical protein